MINHQPVNNRWISHNPIPHRVSHSQGSVILQKKKKKKKKKKKPSPCRYHMTRYHILRPIHRDPPDIALFMLGALPKNKKSLCIMYSIAGKQHQQLYHSGNLQFCPFSKIFQNFLGFTITNIGNSINSYKLKLLDDNNILPISNVKDLRPYHGEDLRSSICSQLWGIDAEASTTYNENSILIMENSYSGGCETLDTPIMFLNPSILSFVTILIWSCFILKRCILQVKVVVALFNLKSLFS